MTLVNKNIIHSLKGVYEFLGLYGRRVDDLINVLAIAVCIGGGDVNEGLEVMHLLGQAEELLCGDHIELQGVSAGEEREIHTVLKKTARLWECVYVDVGGKVVQMSLCVGGKSLCVHAQVQCVQGKSLCVFLCLLDCYYLCICIYKRLFADDSVFHSNMNLQRSRNLQKNSSRSGVTRRDREA